MGKMEVKTLKAFLEHSPLKIITGSFSDHI